MITITAMKWVPPFAAGQVRDHRARWVLNEVNWPYEVRLIDAPTLKSAEYRARQPFGQVPYLEEDGRPTLFESGAIVIDVATRADKLLPTDANERSQVICWVIAALNSIEPFLMNIAEVEYFIDDKQEADRRRPIVVAAAQQRLEQLQTALGERIWLVGNEFTIADLMMSSVLKIARRPHILEKFPALVAYQDRCFDRPAYRKAVADQLATIDAHEMADMKFDV
ncbi:glutathione S-transferase family protein [Aliihoeflea sp. PC F10.4]